MSSSATARLALPILLVLATAFFAVGAIAEHATRANSAPGPSHARVPSETSGQLGGESTAHRLAEGRGSPHRETAAAHAQESRLLGVDVESTPLVIPAVVAGVALSALAATRLGRRSAILAMIGVVALALAAIDVREVVHQLNESRSGIAAIALAVAVLHFLAGLVAGRAATTVARS